MASQKWFKSKESGIAWGTPATKQGWYVFATFVAVWLIALAYIVPRDINDTVTTADITAFAIVFIIDLAFLAYFSVKYGDVDTKHITSKVRKKTRAKKSKSD